MRVTVIQIVIDTFQTVLKGLGKETEGIGNLRKNQDRTDNTAVKIGSNIQKRAMKICCHLDSSEKSPVTDLKNSLGVK